MEDRPKVISEDIADGFRNLKKDLRKGRLFQVDMCQGGVIMTSHLFSSLANIKCVELKENNSMSVKIDSYYIRLIMATRFQWMDQGSDPYYQVVVWLAGGTEAVFFFWA